MYVSEAPSMTRRLDLIGQPAPVAPPPQLGTFARAEFEAQQIVANESAAWRKAGSLLTGGNYRLQIEHPGAGANNRFRRYSFINSDKCNLFALDVAWRSGFRVPLLDIGTPAVPRYSYPLANTLTSYAESAIAKGHLRLLGLNGLPWGAPQTHLLPSLINFSIRRLGALFLVVGWRGTGSGHVGIIRQIQSVAFDNSRPRRITSITYDGWEARGGPGAQSLVGRQWRKANCGPTGVYQNNPPGPLNHAFCRIHLISLLSEQTASNRGIQTGYISAFKL
jgi:hypothetical protein